MTVNTALRTMEVKSINVVFKITITFNLGTRAF